MTARAIFFDERGAFLDGDAVLEIVVAGSGGTVHVLDGTIERYEWNLDGDSTAEVIVVAWPDGWWAPKVVAWPRGSVTVSTSPRAL